MRRATGQPGQSSKRDGPNQAKPPGGRPSAPVWIGAALLIGIGLVAFWNWVLLKPFQFANGPNQVSVTRGFDEVITYTVTYRGFAPATVEGAFVMLKGQTLFVAVESLELVPGGAESGRRVQPDGSLQPGQQFAVQPGDELQLRVLLQGVRRGGNYLSGFRLMFEAYGMSLSQDVPAPGDYVIVVN